MPFVHQQGILDASTSALADGDVIMAAAIVGHAYTRLFNRKACSFETEAPLDIPPQHIQDTPEIKDLIAVVGAINLALQNAGADFGKPTGRKVEARITPTYVANGNVRIIGGSGDLPLDSPLRYDPPAPATQAARDLLALALRQLKPGGSEAPLNVGYQGSGAYTGFVDGRAGGQSNLFSTYRHVIPNDPASRRWIPSAPVDNVTLGKGDAQKIWGMIQTNKFQATLAAQGMYFQDADVQRNPAVLCEACSVVGYTHGMIQAIYDVEMHKLADPGNPAGTPYEIAVGKVGGSTPASTTKLASCICCALFMEATDHPASCTHLGRADSWAPLYPENPGGGVPNMSTVQNKSRAAANDKWAAYCATVITAGIPLIEKNVVGAEHVQSAAKLKACVAGLKPVDFANLILDAVTLGQNETARLKRTLRPAA
jgi:hypothetical protein